MTLAVLGYLGPGAAVTLLGAALALLAAIVVALIGLVWYPTRCVVRWWRRAFGRSRSDENVDR